VLTPERELAGDSETVSTIGTPLILDVATVMEGDLRADLSLRDFTINAMAFMIDADTACNRADRGGFDVEIVDPHGGQADLARGVVREVGAQSLQSDCLRLLRAVRFSAQFGFGLEAETRRKVVAQAARITDGGAERIRDELWKALALPAPDRVVAALDALGLLPHLLPDAAQMMGVEQSPPHHLDVYEHTLLVVHYAALLRDWLLGRSAPASMDGELLEWDEVFANPVHAGWRSVLSPWQAELREHFCVPIVDKRTRAHWLVWAALFHDMGKPATRTEETQADGSTRFRFFEHQHLSAEIVRERLDALRFGRSEINSTVGVVDAHMRPHSLDSSFAGTTVSRRACHRFFRDTGGKSDRPEGIDVLLLALADRMATPAALSVDVLPDERARELAAWEMYLGHVSELLSYGFAEDGLMMTKLNPLVNGHVLMQQLDLSPGPELGKLLGQLAEAQAAGEIETSEDALALAKTWLEPV